MHPGKTLRNSLEALGVPMFPSPRRKILSPRRYPGSLVLLVAMASVPFAAAVHAQVIPSSALHTLVKGVSVAQQVDNLLDKARAARSAGRLVQPPGDNAAEFYAQVLKLDPGNVEARNAIIGLRSAIHVSLANSHGQSAELQRLDSMASKLVVQQGIGGATAGPTPSPPSPPTPPQGLPGPPPVHHPSLPAGHAASSSAAQASPPPDQPFPPPTEHWTVSPPGDSSLPSAGQVPSSAANGGTASSGANAASPVTPNDIDKIIQGLPLANIVFNPPDTMRMEQTQSVQLLLSGSATAEELQKQITAAGSLISDQVQVSNLLDTRLTGVNFQIEAVTPEQQAVGTTRTSHWEWRVTPTRHGAQQLELTINAILRIDGVDREVSIRTFDRTINVNVDWFDSVSAFIAANWQWLWTAIFVPIALVAWRWFRKGKSAKAA
jgi:hypothetical protein